MKNRNKQSSPVFDIINIILWGISLIMVATIYLSSLFISVGISINILYCLPIFYSWILKTKNSEIILGILTTLLTGCSILFSTYKKGDIYLFNPLLSLIAVWITVTLVTISKRSIQEVTTLQEKLSQKVKSQGNELTRNRQSFSQLIEAIDDYDFIFLSPEGFIQTWNKGAERIKGYNSDEIIGKHFSIFFTKADQSKQIPQKLLEKAIKNQKVSSEGWRQRKDGKLFWGNSTITTLTIDNKFIGFLKITRDLTERLEKEQQKELSISLKSKNRTLKEFSYVCSHDLQEPVRTIKGFSEFLLNNYSKKLDNMGVSSLNHIKVSTERLLDMIVGLQNYTCLDKELTIESINLQNLCQEVFLDLKELIEEVKGTIRFKNLPQVKGNKIQLRLLFQNLISNGLKYRKENTPPSIELTASKKDNYWQFCIEDNGIGIHEINQKKIFDIFNRLNPENQYKGIGIGLSTAKKIVETHGGKIWVNSDGKSGSRFYFTLKS